MADHVLVPIDGSEQSQEAFEYALELYPEATFVGLHVINPLDGSQTTDSGMLNYSEQWYEDAQTNAEQFFEPARETAAERGLTLETTTEVGRPAREVVRHAQEGAFTAIVIGSHGRTGLSRILLGSVAETVVRRSPVPVTVVR